MTDAEKMREAAAQACDRIAGNTADFGRDYRRAAGQCAAMIRALPIPDAKPWNYRETTIARLMNDPQVQEILRKPPVDASAPAVDCQQAGLVTATARVSASRLIPTTSGTNDTGSSLGLQDEVKAALVGMLQIYDGLPMTGIDAGLRADRARAALARLERDVG